MRDDDVNVVQQARERTNLSRIELAEIVGLSVLDIVRLERGSVVRITDRQYQLFMGALPFRGNEHTYLRTMTIFEVDTTVRAKRVDTGRFACRDCDRSIPEAYYNRDYPYCANCRQQRRHLSENIAAQQQLRAVSTRRPPRTRFVE